VEPYGRALRELGKQVLVTGRRQDQGAQRTALDVWEATTRTLNPLSAWSWGDVTAFCDQHDVPVNPAHSYVFRADKPIPATERHRAGLPWKKVDLGKPYWRASAAEISGGAPVAYICKSFGDTHTSVPVLPNESERAGRFVRTKNSECGIHTRVSQPGDPHGGKLVNLGLASESEAAALARDVRASAGGAVLELTERQACDVELLLNGGFSPLDGFMDKETYEHVVEHMRLPELQLFGLPVVLDVHQPVARGARLLLRHGGADIAVLTAGGPSWEANKVKEAAKCFGTASAEHPGVEELLTSTGRYYVGGKLQGLGVPVRSRHFKSPREVRLELAGRPNKGGPVVAFQCRNPIHQAHYELVRRVLADVPGASVLIHPTCGPTQPGDIDGDTRILTYEALEREVADPRVSWAYLPYSMKMAGPREAIQHMLIRKNFGCTHFIIGRDMAGTKSTLTEKDFYGPYDAQELAKKHSEELGVGVLTYENMVHTSAGFMPESEAKKAGAKTNKLSGTEFRRLLRSGEPIPKWFAFDSVVKVLRG
jgi:sulfate adenylyltransferase